MYVNGIPVYASGTIVVNSGETASIDMPGAPATLQFSNDGGASSVAVDANQPIIHLKNFDTPAGAWATTSFVGAQGSPAAGKTIFLTFASFALGAAPNYTRVIHFTVVVQ